MTSDHQSAPGIRGLAAYERFTVVLLVVIASIAFIGTRLLTMNVGLINVDEAHWAACAARLLAVHGWPLIDSRDNKPPGIFLFYEAAFRVASAYDMRAVRLAMTGWLLLAALVLVATVRQFASIGVALITGALLLIALSIDHDMIAVKTEVLAILPLSLACFATIRAASTLSPWSFLAAGFFVAMAALCKQPAALLGVAPAVVALAAPRVRIKSLAVLAFGFVLPLAVVVGFYALLGAFQALLWQVWGGPAIYMTIDRISTARRLVRIVTYTEEYSRFFPPLPLLALLGLVCIFLSLWKKTDLLVGSRRRIALGCAAFALSAYLAALAGSDLYPNYFILVFPGLVLLAGWCIDRYVKAMPALEPVWRAAVCVAMLFGCASGAVLALKEPIKAMQEGAIPERAIVQRIKETSKPGDFIYVWGYSPELYVESDRVPASRYVLTHDLVGFFGEGPRKVDAEARRRLAEPGSMQNFVRELKEERPTIFVDASDTDAFGRGSFALEHYPELQRLVETDYVPDRDFVEGGGRKKYRLWRLRASAERSAG